MRFCSFLKVDRIGILKTMVHKKESMLFQSIETIYQVAVYKDNAVRTAAAFQFFKYCHKDRNIQNLFGYYCPFTLSTPVYFPTYANQVEKTDINGVVTQYPMDPRIVKDNYIHCHFSLPSKCRNLPITRDLNGLQLRVMKLLKLKRQHISGSFYLPGHLYTILERKTNNIHITLGSAHNNLIHFWEAGKRIGRLYLEQSPENELVPLHWATRSNLHIFIKEYNY